MNSHVSRRKFVLGVSSVSSVLVAGTLNSFAKMGGESFIPFLSDASSQSQTVGQSKPKVLVFDVNQTMLDLNALRPHFVRVFAAMAKRWMNGFFFYCSTRWW